LLGRGATRGGTYNVVLVLKVGVVLLHRRIDGLEGRHQIVEDGSAPCFALWLAESAGVDDAHLLEHRRLAALASSCGLVSRVHTMHAWIGGLPSSSSFTSRSARLRSTRRVFSMSSFFLNSGSAGFLPKHMIAGAIHSEGVTGGQLQWAMAGERNGRR
jgi:hypothetical protein